MIQERSGEAQRGLVGDIPAYAFLLVYTALLALGSVAFKSDAPNQTITTPSAGPSASAESSATYKGALVNINKHPTPEIGSIIFPKAR